MTGHRLDSMICEVFSSLGDSVMQWEKRNFLGINYQLKILQTAIDCVTWLICRKLAIEMSGRKILLRNWISLLNSTYNSRRASLKSFFHRIIFFRLGWFSLVHIMYLKPKQVQLLLCVWEGAAAAKCFVSKRAINTTVWPNTAVMRTQTNPWNQRLL